MPRRERRGNNLPWRYLHKGKPSGFYYITVKGFGDVNLKTKDPDESIRRMKAARAGQRIFKDDGGVRAADAVASSIAGTGDATTSPVVDPPAAPALGLPPAGPPGLAPPQALPPVQTSPAALPPVNGTSSPALVADEVLPPPPGWADGVRAAAAEAGASSAPGAGEGAADDGTITPDMLEALLDEAAARAVDLQLWAQSWVAKKGWLGAKVKVAEVPETAKGRDIGKKIWRRCFARLAERYMPNLEIPDWLAAPMLVGVLTLPVQFGEGAEIIPDDAKKGPAASAGAPAAAAA